MLVGLGSGGILVRLSVSGRMLAQTSWLGHERRTSRQWYFMAINQFSYNENNPEIIVP
jgi:hypothetical protein